MEQMIGKVKLNLDYYCGEELYSDGEEIENEILDIVKENDNSNYNKIIKERKKWPILYHLSDIRSNIIEWIDIDKDKTVLEIGSGCGAITGVLSKKAKKVTCIELSKKRSLINAYRNKNRSNIEIVVGNFQDIKIKKKYDYITLIGVYEYAESYIRSKKPYIDFLSNIFSYLKPHGKIILAIENKYGMKYWAGCSEDHFGRYFESIEGYTTTEGIKTFSKKELEDILKECEITNYKFYYPYPDYKLPSSIYSDEHLPKQGELDNNQTNFDMPRISLFDERKAFDSVIANNLFPIYSNSFLIIIDKGISDYEESNIL